MGGVLFFPYERKGRSREGHNMMIDNEWESATEGIRSPIKLRNGKYNGGWGSYWAWPVDGYFDLHFTDLDLPDGSDVIHECLPSLAEARKEARELNQYETRGF